MKELISKLNISDELRGEIGDELTAEQIEQVLEQHNKSLYEQHREALANDDDFVSKYRDKGYKIAQAKIIEDTQRVLKDLGYDGVLKDDKGNKPPHIVVREFYESVSDKLQTKGKGTEKLQGELQEIATKYKELQTAIESGSLPAIADAKRELNALKAEREHEQATNWLSTFLKPSDNYKIERNKVLRLLSGDLQSAGYKIAKDEDAGGFTIVDASGNAVMSEDKTRVLKPDEIVSRFENDYIAKSNGTTDKKTVTVDTTAPKFEQKQYTKRQQAAAEVLKRAEQQR